MLNLKTIRKQNEKTQIEIAKYLNIDQTTYSGYETGKSNPSLEILIKLADLYKISLDYLCGRPNSNLVFIESLTETQQKLVTLIQMLSQEQSLIALGYFSEMLNLPYSEVKPVKPF